MILASFKLILLQLNMVQNRCEKPSDRLALNIMKYLIL